jgi:hypothetical protein
VREAIDACIDYNYLDGSTIPTISPAKVQYKDIPLTELQQHIRLISDEASSMLDPVPHRDTERDIEPYVFLTDNTESEPIMKSIIDTFTFNERQELAFRLIANHSIGITKVGPQLLMGLFGEGGTGKSRLVNALRAWFSRNNRSTELIVTATMGSAAFNIRGSTLHSATNLTVNKRGHSRKRKMIQKKAVPWRDRNYLIIDEVSMLDLRTLENLHDQLS